MSTTYGNNGSRLDDGSSLRLSQETDDRSFSDIVRDLTSHSSELVKGEIALAKREMTDNAKSMAAPIAMFVAAGVIGLVALFLLGHTLAWLLNNIMDAGLAYLVSALIFAAIAGVLAFVGKKRLEQASSPAPTDSIAKAKEDLTWIKSHAH
jgi:F0F1-type ATP synthase assembly protein I